MALETSPTAPVAVRTVANAIGGWIDRLGAVWVEGQVAQLNRRPGMATVFLTLRDTVADISVTVTVARTYVDSLPTPLVEGASIVVHAKPSYYANRGTLSLQAREIRMVGLGELLARLEQEGLEYSDEADRATLIRRVYFDLLGIPRLEVPLCHTR